MFSRLANWRFNEELYRPDVGDFNNNDCIAVIYWLSDHLGTHTQPKETTPKNPQFIAINNCNRDYSLIA